MEGTSTPTFPLRGPLLIVSKWKAEDQSLGYLRRAWVSGKGFSAGSPLLGTALSARQHTINIPAPQTADQAAAHAWWMRLMRPWGVSFFRLLNCRRGPRRRPYYADTCCHPTNTIRLKTSASTLSLSEFDDGYHPFGKWTLFYHIFLPFAASFLISGNYDFIFTSQPLLYCFAIFFNFLRFASWEMTEIFFTDNHLNCQQYVCWKHTQSPDNIDIFTVTFLFYVYS